MVKINNCDAFAEGEWIVARKVDHEYWFYGVYEDWDRAMKVAIEIEGVVIRAEETKEDK